MSPSMRHDRIVGCILGTAVGDALGLPYEGVSPKRAAKLLGSPDRYRFFFRWGMISDDTEHTCMVAQSLIDARGDVPKIHRLNKKKGSGLFFGGLPSWAERGFEIQASCYQLKPRWFTQ